jgi:two-component sensor histidine kinase
MFNKTDSSMPSRARRSGRGYIPPELAIDLEADNVLLRAALAKSEGAGVRRELVTMEMQHRMGNLLAVVQAIARQTFRSADPAGLEAFSARLYALAAAQKLLIEAETQPASLRKVVTEGLAPHCPEGERFAVSGPEIALDGRRAHALTLALHELATNASKYGSLSVDGGWVDIAWTNADGLFELVWREHGGPPVVVPTRQGFGSVLVSRNLGVAFGGEANLAFEPEGFSCSLRSSSAWTGDAAKTGADI